MKKDFSILFIINLVLRIVIQGLLPILPVFIKGFGVSKSYNGIIIGSAYLMLFVSTYINGKLIPKYLNAKTLFLLSIIPLALAIYLIGTAHSIITVTSFILLLFFSAGFNITSSNILIGYFSTGESAGKNYGIIGISNLCGTLIGGFIVGPILYKFGYPSGFLLFGSAFFVTGLSSLKLSKPIQHTVSFKAKNKYGISLAFILVVLASLLAIITIHSFIFTSSLLLNAHNYTIKSISLFSATGALMASPTPYFMGWLTKKLSPKILIIIIYAMGLAALIILLFPLYIPTYLVGVAFIAVLSFALRPVIMALIFDWFTEDQLPMTQSYLAMAGWVAAIIGYLATGSLLQYEGQTITLLFGICALALAIAIMLFGVKNRKVAYNHPH